VGINVEIIKHRRAFRPSNIKDLNSKVMRKQTPPKRQQYVELPYLVISNKKQEQTKTLNNTSQGSEEDNPAHEVSQISGGLLA
jgi:hypothetical protein